MLVVVTIFSKLGSAAASGGFIISFFGSLAADVTTLVGLARDISSLAIGLGDDFEDLDFGGFSFLFFGFFSATRLSHGSTEVTQLLLHCII